MMLKMIDGGSMENFSTEHLIVIILVIVAFVYWKNRQRDEEGRLPDLAVTRNKVLEVISAFEMNEVPSKEADIQKQLLSFLENEFYHVQGQKTIGGIHAKQIDFDIGRERVGIEIKMAKSLYKKVNLIVCRDK